MSREIVAEIDKTLDTTMSQQHTFSMTLRLEPRIEELVAEAAYERGLTRSDWIRAAIRNGLRAQRTRHEDHDNGTEAGNRS